MEGGGLFGGDNRAGSPEGERRAREFHQCSFCKRGFTNAQALGGHMNIHRRERGGGGGVGGKSSSAAASRGGGAATAPPAGQHGDQVHLGLTLGRSPQDVDLELRLGH